MPKSRQSATLAQLQVDLANLKALDPNLDFGDGLSIAALVQMMEETEQEIEVLNQILVSISEAKRSIRAKERALTQLKDRLHLGIAFKYGKKSREYRMVKPPSTKRRKKKETPSSDAGSTPGTAANQS
jgi:hypothetical protein